LSNNEPRVSRAFSQHFPYYPSDVYDPSTSSFEDYEHCCCIGCADNDASGLHESSARDSFPSSATQSSSSTQDERVVSAHSVSGDSTRSQRDRFSGFGLFNANNLPQSPIPDSAHPWDEIRQPCNTALVETSSTSSPGNGTPDETQQSYSTTSVEETPKSSTDNGAPRLHCDQCNVSFATKSNLTRHVKTAHKDNIRVFWVCPIESCGKSKKEKRYWRKDNFRRHCVKKHPRMDLTKLEL
jgi:hypothetical protein